MRASCDYRQNVQINSSDLVYVMSPSTKPASMNRRAPGKNPWHGHC